MESKTAVKIFESLSSGIRLDIYRMLVKAGSTGMVAGQIASELEVPPSNLSFHLKALVHAELLEVEQEGRFLRYRANMPLMFSLITYLTEECCQGELAQCISPETGELDSSSCFRSPSLTSNEAKT
ncbi:helix-turn-helix domain-containing protein [Laspinema sp. A4]|uniref:ArsR/SmtB family transcription factor n=1 Tax=Laspinema sp. D2d TaxID=2953686 RepID=UPI0021BAEF7A|nr:helix-turn-helix domain-containing protein [Laspinema sp. D2d]MCT7984640.1 helix-turn-helix domain-containing protein [Laspinema sp. D2d]